jgi:hypothetical protein
MKSSFKKVALLVIFSIVFTGVHAHVIVGELEKLSAGRQAFFYLQLGYQHIIPMGMDHIFFVLSLFLLRPQLKPILWQSSAFTLAHSITLALAMYHFIIPPSAIIEPLIALSIVFLGLQNIFSPKLQKSRIGLVFLFGLVHGLGFASSLSRLGLPADKKLTCLFLFNVGVELGQLSIILLAWYLVGRRFGSQPTYRRRIVIPASLCIVLIAGYWTIQRVLLQGSV